MAQSNRTPHRTGRGIWREWRAELIALVAVALGIFLLVEQYNIRETAGRLLVTSLRVVLAELKALFEALFDLVRGVRTSDLLGMLLIVVALYIVVRRIRYRVQRSPNWSPDVCPRCGRHTLRRVHRRPGDVLARLLPLRRYECVDETCGWTGLRARRRRHREAGGKV